MGIRTRDTLHTGLDAAWDDSCNQKYVEQSDQPSHRCEPGGVAQHHGVIGKQANSQDQDQRVHGDALIPAQREYRDTHDLTEKQAAK